MIDGALQGPIFLGLFYGRTLAIISVGMGLLAV